MCSEPPGLTAGWACYRPPTTSPTPGAGQHRWRRPASRPTADRYEAGPEPEVTEKRRRIDVALPLAEAEEEPVGGRRHRVALPHDGAERHTRGREAPVGCGSTVGLVDHEVANAGHETVEPHDARGRGDHRRTRGRLVLQTTVARTERAQRRAERIDNRRGDRRQVARRHGHDQRDDRADHDCPRSSRSHRTRTAWRAGAKRPWCGSARPGSRWRRATPRY